MKLKTISIVFLILLLLFIPYFPSKTYLSYSQEETTETAFPLPERFTQEKEKLGPGVYLNYSSTNSEWFFWEIITETINDTYIVVIINQTLIEKKTEFLEVPKQDALPYKNYLWTNPRNLIVGETDIPLVNGTADVISEVIIRFKDKYQNTLEISAYRLVVTSGEMKGMVIICEKDSGVVLQLYLPHNEDTPLLQIQATNLKLANPREKTNENPHRLSKEDIINMTVASIAFFLSLIIVYLANKIKTPVTKVTPKHKAKINKAITRSTLEENKEKKK